ncbi:hypothetical protein [Aeromonas salmonicida]
MLADLGNNAVEMASATPVLRMVITFLLWRDKYPASLNCMLAPSEDLLAPDGNHKVQAWNNKAADLN